MSVLAIVAALALQTASTSGAPSPDLTAVPAPPPMEAPVARISVRGGKADGVVLTNGDDLRAGMVLSSVDPNLTFLRFLERKVAVPGYFGGK